MIGPDFLPYKPVNLVVSCRGTPAVASSMEAMPHTARMWLAVLLAAVIHSNVNPTPRKIGAFYFDPPGESQVWVDLDAQAMTGGPSAIRINITIKFRGRQLRGTPKTATIRAYSNALVAPTHIRVPVLKFHLADDTVLDLTAPGSTYVFIASCETCSNDTIITDVPFAELDRITDSSAVLLDVLGFEGKLVQEDIRAIREFVEAVRDGAVVKN